MNHGDCIKAKDAQHGLLRVPCGKAARTNGVTPAIVSQGVVVQENSITSVSGASPALPLASPRWKPHGYQNRHSGQKRRGCEL